MDAGESLAGITDEAGVVVVAGELAAVDADAVYPARGEGVSTGLGLLGELEEPAEELAPLSLSRLDPDSEPMSPATELNAGASPALETTLALSGLEGCSRSLSSGPPDPEPISVGFGPEA